MVKDDFVTENGDLYYFDSTGNQPNFVFVSDKASHWYYMRYFKATKGFFSALFGFDAEFLDRSQSDYKTSVHNLNGQQYYFDTKTGIMVTNRYVSDDQGNWYYFGKDDRALHGFQTINKDLYYFNNKGANKFEEVFSTQVKTTTSPTKILVLSFVMPFITIHQLALMATSLKISITLAMTVPSRQAGQKSTVTDTTLATILMTTPQRKPYTGVISSQLFSPDGKLLTNGLQPEFKRTGENVYELEGVYVTDTNGNIKEGPYQYDGKVIGSKYSSIRQSQWSTFDEWNILNGHLYHFDSMPMTFTAPNGQKVTTNVAITTTNKALTYRGVTFNFDAKGIDATKEKAIHFDQLQTDPSGTSYLYENGQKVTGLKTFDGVSYYFYEDGRQAKGTEATINGKTYQFDQLTGIMTRNAFSKSYNYEGSPRYPYYPTRYYGNDGAALTDWQTIDVKDYYFLASGNLETGRFVIGYRAYNTDDNGVVADPQG